MALTYVKSPTGASGVGLGNPPDSKPTKTSFQGSPKLSKVVTTDGATYLLSLPTAKYVAEGIIVSLPTNSTSFIFKGAHASVTSLNHLLNSAGVSADIGTFTINVGGHKYKNAIHTGGGFSTQDAGDGFKILKVHYNYTILGE